MNPNKLLKARVEREKTAHTEKDVLSENLRLKAKFFPHLSNYFSKKRIHFDLVFVDPPYGEEITKKTFSKLSQSGILAPNMMLCIEHSVRTRIPLYDYFSLVKEKRFGATQITILTVQNI